MIPAGARALIGHRFAAALREAYPGDTAWRLQHDFAVAPDHARAWLDGALPEPAMLLVIMKRQGPAFAEAVFPTGNETLWRRWFRVEKNIADLERKVANVRSDISGLNDRIRAHFTGGAPLSGDLVVFWVWLQTLASTVRLRISEYRIRSAARQSLRMYLLMLQLASELALEQEGRAGS